MLTTNKILINTSNLHVGGGVQVATSFLHELSKMKNIGFEPIVYMSTEVSNELKKLNVNILQKNWHIYNTYGLQNFRKHRKEFAKFSIVFTVFGPNYFLGHYTSITGFAQAWIIYPDNEIYQGMTIKQKIFSRLKFFLQKEFFKRSDVLIVELEHVKEQLVKKNIQTDQNIHIVKNCFSSIYLQENQWETIHFDIKQSDLNIGFIGRDYLHKNLSILPKVKNILKDKYNINAQFYVTLTQEEWRNRDSYFTKNINNVGPLSTTQCPNFYKKMDAIIFPSLLECFSATPLEALVMKTPVFASDRRFVKDTCYEYAHYFDPLQPDSIADVIAQYFSLPEKTKNIHQEESRQHALNFSDAKYRATEYIRIIHDVIR